MVGILLKIGKQPENVGEEEVFGRFCICVVTEKSIRPPKPVFRRADIRRISAGYPPDIRAPEESSGWIFRDVTDAKTTKNLFLSDIFRLFSNFQQNPHHMMFLNEKH